MPPNDTGMRFETPGEEYGRPPAEKPGFDLSAKLVKWGLVSSVQEAQYVLIGVAVLGLIAAIFFYMSSGSSAPPPPPTGV